MCVDAPKREENYSKAVSDFKQHAANMTTTAMAVAKSGVISDRRQLEAIERTVNKVRMYTYVCIVLYSAKQGCRQMAEYLNKCLKNAWPYFITLCIQHIKC